MESLHKSVLIGTICGMCLVAILIISGYTISCNRQIKMAQLGYEQVQTIGKSDYVWQRVK